MVLDEFIRSLTALLEEQRFERHEDPGEGNYRCEECSACYNCRFCLACSNCEDCTYCEECVDCLSCTQSKRSVSCARSSYCEDSRDCEDSRYLAFCVECRNCVHCLGCVGLEGAEFYVLNEKYTRKAYFQLLNDLRAEWGPRMEAGWRPEAIGLESDERGLDEDFGHDDDSSPWAGASSPGAADEDVTSPWSETEDPPSRSNSPAPSPGRRPGRAARATEDSDEDSSRPGPAPAREPPRPSSLAGGRQPAKRPSGGLRRGRRPPRGD